MQLEGTVQNGVVVLDSPQALPEGAKVRIELIQTNGMQPPEEEIPTLFERLRAVVGSAQGLPADASTNVDHYLYGHPKK